MTIPTPPDEALTEEEVKMMLMTGVLSKAEAGYQDMPARTSGQQSACINCRFFNSPDGCLIVNGTVAQAGLCNMYFANEDADPLADLDITIDDEEVEIETRALADDDEIPDANKRPGLLGRIWKAIAGNEQPDTGFTVHKSGGKWRWVAVFSNNFKDRDGEIISAAAWDRYLARVSKGMVPMPELWSQHIPGTRHGVTKWIDRVGHIMVAAGEFDDTPAAKEAVKAYRSGHEFRLSHGFKYPRWAFDGKVYDDLNTFEITTLPAGYAQPANDLTEPFAVEKGKEITMPMTETQKEGLRLQFGDAADDIISRVEAADQKAQKLAASGVEYKSLDDFSDVTEKADDGEKQTTADNADGLLLPALLDAQDKQADAIQALIDGAKARDEARAKEIADLRNQVDTLTKAVKAFVDATPQGVDTGTGNVVSDDEATEAKKATQDFDPFWGAEMQVPAGE